jgi:4-diphosphocytidyl-2-C-methyl-D-erythritol kinase
VSMRGARAVAQAKINLWLRILAREASGYHQIETLFCRLALGDGIVVRAGGRTCSLDCTGPELPDDGLGPMEKNLAWRAAHAYKARTGWPTGFAIELDKRIPVGGGLGGGSADAGAVLRALDALSPQPVGAEALVSLASSLGADVPFLTQSHTTLALGWGRGERLLSLSSLPARHVMLFAPPVRIDTAAAYGWISQKEQPRVDASLRYLADLASWSAAGRLAANDFEEVVSVRHESLRLLLDTLRGDQYDSLFGPRRIVQMSGSGSTIFVAYDERPVHASSFAIRVPEANVRTFSTVTAERVEEVEVLD